MRPPDSLPAILCKSMPNSRAIRRSDGDATGARDTLTVLGVSASSEPQTQFGEVQSGNGSDVFTISDTGVAVKNADLGQRLDAARARHAVDWRWIKGHAGHELNERADALARQGMLETLGER